MEEAVSQLRQRSLLEHFAVIRDPREPAKVRYPLPEVLLLVVAATIAGCDDYDEIAAWGRTIWPSCAGLPSFISGCRARTGCGW